MSLDIFLLHEENLGLWAHLRSWSATEGWSAMSSNCVMPSFAIYSFVAVACCVGACMGCETADRCGIFKRIISDSNRNR